MTFLLWACFGAVCSAPVSGLASSAPQSRCEWSPPGKDAWKVRSSENSLTTPGVKGYLPPVRWRFLLVLLMRIFRRDLNLHFSLTFEFAFSSWKESVFFFLVFWCIFANAPNLCFYYEKDTNKVFTFLQEARQFFHLGRNCISDLHVCVHDSFPVDKGTVTTHRRGAGSSIQSCDPKASGTRGCIRSLTITFSGLCRRE